MVYAIRVHTCGILRVQCRGWFSRLSGSVFKALIGLIRIYKTSIATQKLISNAEWFVMYCHPPLGSDTFKAQQELSASCSLCRAWQKQMGSRCILNGQLSSQGPHRWQGRPQCLPFWTSLSATPSPG